MKRFLAMLLAALMVCALAACGGNSNSGSDAGNAGSPAGGNDGGNAGGGAGSYLNVMLSTNVVSLDTNLATDGESFEVIADCIDGLMQMDDAGSAIPAIAESYDLSEDGTTYTFHLREDAKWSNGTPVTANDFVFAWQLGCETNIEYGYMFGSSVGCVKNGDPIYEGTMDRTELGVSAPDDHTLVVELDVPVSFFPSLLYFPAFYPINEEFYNSLADGTYGTSPETFLSNGAFILESYSPGTASLSLKRNPDYYDAARVKLDGINYQVVGSSDNALTSYRSGALDLVTIGGDQVVAAQNDASLASNIDVVGAGYMWYLTFSQTAKNAQGGMLANANLRLAISNALDRDYIVDNFVMDGSLPTYTAVPPQFAASATTGDDFSADQTRFSQYCSYDVAKAQQYFETAKSELGTDTFTFNLLYGNNEGDEVAKVAQAIKEQVEANLPGITINLQSTTKAERLNDMQNDNYDIALTRWGPDYADPMTYMGMWITNASNNYGFWSNAEYDQIIKDCTTGAYITDYDARWEALYRGEEIVLKEAVIAPLYTKANVNIIATGVSGVEFHPIALNRVYKNAAKG